MPRKKAFPKEKTVRIHLVLPRKLYQKIWQIAAERYEKPVGKLCVVIAEAIEEYIQRHGGGRRK